MILSEKLEHGMEYENGQENIEKLRRIGGQILAASRDELYLGMRFLDVALSSFVYQMDSEVHPFGTDGGAIYFHPRELGGLGICIWCTIVCSAIWSNRFRSGKQSEKRCFFCGI